MVSYTSTVKHITDRDTQVDELDYNFKWIHLEASSYLSKKRGALKIIVH